MNTSLAGMQPAKQTLLLHADHVVTKLLHCVDSCVTGGSREGYCKWMCASTSAKGWRPVVLNYRGCAGLELTSPSVYCASFTDDIHLAVEEIQRQYPEAHLFAAGYSLGSLILTKFLAEAALGRWQSAGKLQSSSFQRQAHALQTSFSHGHGFQ